MRIKKKRIYVLREQWTLKWESTLNILKLIDKWWSLANIKSVSKGTWKQDIDIEPLGSTNVGRFTEFIHKFATWLNEGMLSGKRGLSKQTFSSCHQTADPSQIISKWS